MKTLIVFFSAEYRRTAEIAVEFAEHMEADLFEIVPVEPYTEKDMNWRNPFARCNREHAAKKDVPVQGRVENWEEYDKVFIGFPIWYGYAPNVVSTFCKDYDWTGKEVYVFATSGGSGIGKTAEKLKPYIEGAYLVGAKLTQSYLDLEQWAIELKVEPLASKTYVGRDDMIIEEGFFREYERKKNENGQDSN